MVIDPFLLLGIIGMLLIIVGFLGIQTHRISQDDLSFDLLNCIGSLLLVVYAIAGKVWPFAILNGMIFVYSLKDIVQDIRKK